MQIMTLITAGCTIFFVVYTLLKGIEYKQKIKSNEPDGIYSIMKRAQPKQIDVEIKSSDLKMKAENLINTHDVYSMQAEQLYREINLIEDKIERENASCIRSESEVKSLIRESLRLQESKCKIEAKMIKITQDLDKIAKEELRRQVMRAGR